MRTVIRPAVPADHDQVRQLFRAYQAWLQQDICFKDFEAELADLTAAYHPPEGGIWVAEHKGEILGTVALRPLKGGVAELRRLWLMESARGQNLGKKLVVAAIEGARAGGYARIELDTFPFMAAAMRLYRDAGFREAPNRYNDQRIFMALEFSS